MAASHAITVRGEWAIFSWGRGFSAQLCWRVILTRRTAHPYLIVGEPLPIIPTAVVDCDHTHTCFAAKLN